MPQILRRTVRAIVTSNSYLALSTKRSGAHTVLQTIPQGHLAVVVTTCYNLFVQSIASKKELQYVFSRPELSIRPLPHFLEDVIGCLIKIAAGHSSTPSRHRNSPNQTDVSQVQISIHFRATRLLLGAAGAFSDICSVKNLRLVPPRLR